MSISDQLTLPITCGKLCDDARSFDSSPKAKCDHQIYGITLILKHFLVLFCFSTHLKNDPDNQVAYPFIYEKRLFNCCIAHIDVTL